MDGGFAPTTPGFIAFGQTDAGAGWVVAAPWVRTHVSAQVASLRSRILWRERFPVSPFFTAWRSRSDRKLSRNGARRPERPAGGRQLCGGLVHENEREHGHRSKSKLPATIGGPYERGTGAPNARRPDHSGDARDPGIVFDRAHLRSLPGAAGRFGGSVIGAQAAEVGRYVSGAVKPVQKRGPEFRAPYSGYQPETALPADSPPIQESTTLARLGCPRRLASYGVPDFRMAASTASRRSATPRKALAWPCPAARNLS